MANELGDTNLTGALAVVGTATLGGLPLALPVTWAPTPTDTANAGTIDVVSCRAFRAGNFVVCAGSLRAAITTTSIKTQITIPPPVASTMGTFNLVSGSGTGIIDTGAAAPFPVWVQSTSNNIELIFYPTTASSCVIEFICMYVIA
jgi:hypothetical protein